jgi:hypothetical protein
MVDDTTGLRDFEKQLAWIPAIILSSTDVTARYCCRHTTVKRVGSSNLEKEVNVLIYFALPNP